MRALNGLSVSLALLLLSACAADEPFSIEVYDDYAALNGVINEDAFEIMQLFAEENPDVRVLQFENMPGSDDDETNLEMGLWLRREGFETRALSDAVLESGAVDLFLAGKTRTAECGAQFGVHAWEDEEGRGPKDIAEDDPVHADYIDYMEAVGVPTDFYWFTIDAAGADDMHYLTADEIARFEITTVPMICEG